MKLWVAIQRVATVFCLSFIPAWEIDLRSGIEVRVSCLHMKGVDACAYRLLDAAQSMKKKQIQTAISELQQFSHQTESKLSDTENQIAEKLQALQEGIESKLAFMGLDDDQEELLIKLIDSAVQSVKVKVHELEPITRDLRRMIETLDKLTKV